MRSKSAPSAPKGKARRSGSNDFPEPLKVFRCPLSSGDKTRIHISLTEFKDQQFVDIRKFYQSEGQWKPTGKGLSIAVDDFEAVYAKIRRMKRYLGETLTEGGE